MGRPPLGGAAEPVQAYRMPPLAHEEGQTVIEYALVLSAISLALIVLAGGIGGLDNEFAALIERIKTALT
jgi:Flp pilus assembly pilin Flp